MNELDIARAIAAGDLTSPQRYENFSLFALRISGTGIAFRQALNEIVYRRPENYLTPEFLARCNGLPVIWLHPKGAVLNSQEFSDRIIGMILLPYIKGDEVWGIAKIYDDDAVAQMTEGSLSTSPCVVFRGADSTKLKLDDGSTLLIEGKATVLDSLAICERGVWDKGGEPNGVISETQGAMTMTDEEKAAQAKADADAKARADADGQKLDKVLQGLDAVMGVCDSIGKRMDAVEAWRKDSEAETKRKSNESTMTEEERAVAADKRRKDVAVEEAAKADAQSRADDVASEFGSRAPKPLDGETVVAYRMRLVRPYQHHSAEFGKIDLAKVADAAAFDAIERRIYADAQVASRVPTGFADGRLREVNKIDPTTGQRTNNFFGEHTFIRAMKPRGQRVVRFNRQHAA